MSSSGIVVKSALKQYTISGLVAENLSPVLSVVQSFSVCRVNNCEHNERVLIAGVTAAPVVVAVLCRIERMAACQGAAPLVRFRIAHREEMRRIERNKQLEIDLVRGHLICKLRVQP